MHFITWCELNLRTISTVPCRGAQLDLLPRVMGEHQTLQQLVNMKTLLTYKLGAFIIPGYN